MAEQLTSISPAVLRWARTSLGLQLHEVAEEMGKDQDLIARWEEGAEAPTYAQLERLAYTIYKRPIATFFLPEPPGERDVRAEFRTYLSKAENHLDKDTLLAIREARVRQLSLDELGVGGDAAHAFLGSARSVISNTEVQESAAVIRSQLGVSEAEIEQSRSSDDALSKWRAAIEEKGIYVFKRAFKQQSISGFCLRHERFPLVYLNNKTSFTRQIFTLIHELCHLALDVSGVCAVDLDYTEGLARTERRTEELCDAFAAELLVPRRSFSRLGVRPDDAESLVATARRFRVSPAVIARKCYDLRMIDAVRYRELMVIFFPDNWRAKAEQKSGGDYYSTQLQYLSRRYVLEAYRKHSLGQMSDQSFADFLGVKVASLSGIEGKLIDRQSTS